MRSSSRRCQRVRARARVVSSAPPRLGGCSRSCSDSVKSGEVISSKLPSASTTIGSPAPTSWISRSSRSGSSNAAGKPSDPHSNRSRPPRAISGSAAVTRASRIRASCSEPIVFRMLRRFHMARSSEVTGIFSSSWRWSCSESRAGGRNEPGSRSGVFPDNAHLPLLGTLSSLGGNGSEGRTS